MKRGGTPVIYGYMTGWAPGRRRESFVVYVPESLGYMLLQTPDDEYIFKLGTYEPLIIPELGIKT